MLLLVALFALVTLPGGVGQALTLTTIGATQSLSTVIHTYAYTTQFIMNPTGGTYRCTTQPYGPFKLTAGDALAIDVTSNIPISIYMMTANDYQAWANAATCAVGSSVMYSREKVSSDYIDMIAPSTGDYYLLLLNFSPTNSASVNVRHAYIIQAVTTVIVPVVREVPVTEPVQQYGFYVIGILVLVLALGLLALWRHSSTKKAAGTATVAAKQISSVSGKFCGDCGQPIPIDAEFCPKCGASTEDG
jgi:hypothetical protein